MNGRIYLAIILTASLLFVSADSRHQVAPSVRFPYLLPLSSIDPLPQTLFSAPPEDTLPFAPDQILVKFRPSLSPMLRRIVLSVYQSKPVKFYHELNVYQLTIPDYSSVEEMVYLMKKNPLVEYAEPDYTARIAVTPNDPDFHIQYALSNTGQMIGNVPGSPQGKENADIHAPPAWEETTGSENVVIGIIDTGIDFDHPELQNKYLSRGKDFVNDDDDATDDNGHGTHVASIAAADTNNSIGMAGVAWNSKILPAKAIASNGVGFYSWIIEAIIWLADNGADVINFSIGGDAPSQALEEALKYAYEKDVVLTAAAGNDSPTVLYPAAYDNFCIAVSATDYADSSPGWIATGPEVDVAAPGVRIYGCVPLWFPEQVWGDFELDPYGYGYGTSAAVPHVAGLAALIKSLKPFLKPREIMNIIRYSSDDVNANLFPGVDEFMGYGRINMEKALRPILITKERK